MATTLKFASTRHPAFIQYSNDRPQPAYIWFDCRSGTAWAAGDAEVGSAVPEEVAHGHIQRFEISPYATDAEVNDLLLSIAGDLERIAAGYSSEFRAGSHMAQFDAEAASAIDRLRDEFDTRLDDEHLREPCSLTCLVCLPEEDW